MQPAVLRQLERVDWDFISNTNSASPGLHWYPGNFIPELPAALIEVLTTPGSTVVDPYGGIGTTALAAITRGRAAACYDFHPVAVLTSYVTIAAVVLQSVRPRLLDAVLEEVEGIATADNSASRLQLSLPVEPLRLVDEVLTDLVGNPAEVLFQVLLGPSIHCELEPWYEPLTLKALVTITDRLCQARSIFGRLLGLVMVSALARQLSSQTRSWGHVADRVLPRDLVAKYPQRAAAVWLRRVNKQTAAIASRTQLPVARPFLTVKRIDWANTNARLPCTANLLITSPPYAGAIDYSLAHRLSLHLLGYDSTEIAQLLSSEIGARRKRFHAGHVTDWAEHLGRATAHQISVVEPGGHAAIVLPHKDAGRERGEESIRHVMAANGWALAFSRDRSIRQLRARQSWTSIKRETLLVFARPQGGDGCSSS